MSVFDLIFRFLLALAPLLAWLRAKVHAHAGHYQAPELIERATGKPLAADDLLAYLRGTADEVYGTLG